MTFSSRAHGGKFSLHSVIVRRVSAHNASSADFEAALESLVINRIQRRGRLRISTWSVTFLGIAGNLPLLKSTSNLWGGASVDVTRFATGRLHPWLVISPCRLARKVLHASCTTRQLPRSKPSSKNSTVSTTCKWNASWDTTTTSRLWSNFCCPMETSTSWRSGLGDLKALVS